MTTTPVLSLGAMLCLSIGLMGCKSPFSAVVEAQVEITEVAGKKKAAKKAVTDKAKAKRSYVSPPLIAGYKEGDPLFPGLVPPVVDSLPTGKPGALPPVPNPAGLPVLEQKPGVPVPLTAPDSVTTNPTDGLSYKAGDLEPYSGSAVFTHANGQRKFEGFFKNGLRNGPCMAWYANGTKQYEGKFQGGQLIEGYVYWYYADSLALKLRGDYKKGRMVRGTHWDRQGALYR
jgi:hypothetical protein|tara:strand:+ start:156 stop:845 length:690 start_codon:yes stop_codon:yes gene_type:complete